jgi:hypothetical protein
MEDGAGARRAEQGAGDADPTPPVSPHAGGGPTPQAPSWCVWCGTTQSYVDEQFLPWCAHHGPTPRTEWPSELARVDDLVARMLDAVPLDQHTRVPPGWVGGQVLALCVACHNPTCLRDLANQPRHPWCPPPRR